MNILLFVVILICSFSALYFFYFSNRNSTVMYVGITLMRPPSNSNAPFNWVPYWIGENIHIGDKEVNPFGATIAEVVKKEAYESSNHGQIVYLVLKVSTLRDRSGVYLYKNKPIVVGETFDMRLQSAHVPGLVISVRSDLSYPCRVCVG